MPDSTPPYSTEQEQPQSRDSSRGVSLLVAFFGLATLLAIHALPGGKVFLVVPTHRLFFVLNFVASTLMVFGAACVLRPQLVSTLAAMKRARRRRSVPIPVIVLAVMSLVLAGCSLVARLVLA